MRNGRRRSPDDHRGSADDADRLLRGLPRPDHDPALRAVLAGIPRYPAHRTAARARAATAGLAVLLRVRLPERPPSDRLREAVDVTHLLPAQWRIGCPDCGRPLTLPTQRHAECEERRRWDARAWTACNRCGGVNGRHATTCRTRIHEGVTR